MPLTNEDAATLRVGDKLRVVTTTAGYIRSGFYAGAVCRVVSAPVKGEYDNQTYLVKVRPIEEGGRTRFMYITRFERADSQHEIWNIWDVR